MDSSFVFKGVMNLIDYRFSLELTRGGIQKTLHAKSGEGDGRRALITLTESGKVYDLDGCTARVFFEDNTHSDYLAIVGGCFEFVLPFALLGSAGEKRCEIQLEKNGGVIYSPVFTILVEGSIGGEAYDSVEIGEPIRYQEVIQSLPVGNGITNADEVAVFSSDLKRTQRVKLSNFAKKEDIDEVSEKVDYIENNLSQVGDAVLDIDTKTDKNESDIVALGNRVSATEAQAQSLGKRVSTIEGYNIPQRFDEVNNRIDNISVSGGGGGGITSIPVASSSVLGGIKVNNNSEIKVDNSGYASLNYANFDITQITMMLGQLLASGYDVEFAYGDDFGGWLIGMSSSIIYEEKKEAVFATTVPQELWYFNENFEAVYITASPGLLYSLKLVDGVMTLNSYTGAGIKDFIFGKSLDKTEIVSAVLDALDSAEGGLY